MKYLKFLLVITVGILMPTLSWASLNGFARISLIEGDVQIRHQDSSEWYPAAVNTPLCEGDSIWSPDGARAEVQLQNGSFVRLDRTSSLDVLSLRDDLVQVHVGMGSAYVRTAAMGGRSLQVDLDDSSVQVYDRTRVRIDLSRDGDEDISLLKGAAYVENNGRNTSLQAGEMFSIEDGSAEILPVDPADEWERWNVGRDRAYFARRAAPAYLPDELAVYQNDLDNNGQWTYAPEYGYVWRPTVIVGVDWSPYRIGRWVWIDGDYVWISNERWGWAPYHYGRWVNLPARGWCWVPPARGDVYWAPGYVGWVSTPQYVGWVPLAPGERYYGRGYYGRNSVNITQVNVQNITVNKVIYKNVNIVNAVTVVNRTSFTSGNVTFVKPRENIFARADVHFGRPDIKPARPAMMPAVRTISQAKLPPPAIRNVPFRELRDSHPHMDVKFPAAKPGNGVPRTNGNGVQQSNPWSRQRPAFDAGQPQPVKPGFPARSPQPIGPSVQKDVNPAAATPAPAPREGFTRQRWPESSPQVTGFPVAKPAAGDRQKADNPQNRTWQEAKKPDPAVKPVPQKFGRSIDDGNGAKPQFGGDRKSFSPNYRQKEKPAVSPAPPINMSGNRDQTASPGNRNKPAWQGFPKSGMEQRAAVPNQNRIPIPETRNPVARPAVPAVPQRAANPPASPQQKADRKEWKGRAPGGANGGVKKEDKKPENEKDKPVKFPGA